VAAAVPLRVDNFFSEHLVHLDLGKNNFGKKGLVSPTLREHAVNIQGTCSRHAGNMQPTFSGHAVNI
jgi:hypothetical protein